MSAAEQAETGKRRIIHVRDRPVAYHPSRWGDSFHAVERGYFPVSPTGYRSFGGLAGPHGPSDAELVGLAESVAQEQDWERAAILRELKEMPKPTGRPIANFIHASMLYERAIQHGFFAEDLQRAALWRGASRPLCAVCFHELFQPKPDALYPAWNEGHCQLALKGAHQLRRVLQSWAAGDLTVQPPARMVGTGAYFALPERRTGEPKIDLDGYTPDLSLAVERAAPAPEPEPKAAETSQEPAPRNEGMQFGLFDPPTVATRPSSVRAPGPRLSP